MMDIQQFATKHRLKTRIDDDLTKIIPGKGFSHIYEYDDDLLGVMVMPKPPRRQYWGYTKSLLVRNGFTVVQDGDGEGAATFDPNHPYQAKLAIKAAEIKRRRILSPEDRERRAEHARTLSRRAPSVPETTKP